MPKPKKKSLQPAAETPAPVAKLPPQPERDGRTNLAGAPRIQKFLGVSRSTLMRYVADRKIDAIKMDGGWRFRWEDVERFVSRRMQRAA